MPKFRPPLPARREFPASAPPFFIPYAQGPEEAERVWQATVTFVETQGARVRRDRRIFAVRYVHEGQEIVDVVGEKDASTGEEVLVILLSEPPGPLLICTASRGVARGEPISGPSDAATLDFAKGE
jgi:hypothetical protein